MEEQTRAIRLAAEMYRGIVISFDQATKEVYRFFKTYRGRSGRKWTMMAKNGQSTKERKHNQVKLKGRGKREHKGGYPRRGPGRR